MRRLDAERPVEERQPDLGRSQGIRGRGPSEQPALPGERARILGHRLEHPLSSWMPRERLTLRRQRLGGEQHVVDREPGFAERHGIVDQRNRFDTGECVVLGDVRQTMQTLLNDELLDKRVRRVGRRHRDALGCVDIADVEGDGRGEHSSVGVLGVDRDGVLDEGRAASTLPWRRRNHALYARASVLAGDNSRTSSYTSIAASRSPFPEQLLRFEQELRVVTRISPVIVSLSVRLPENWATRIPARVATTAMPASHIQPVRFAVGA